MKKMKWVYRNCKESIYYIALIIFLSFIFSVMGVVSTIISKNVIDSATQKNIKLLTIFIVIFVSISLLDLIIAPIRVNISSVIRTKLYNRIQFNLYKKVICMEHCNESNYTNLDIINRLDNDIECFTSFMCDIMPSFISLITTFVSAFIVLFNMKPIFAIIVIVFACISSFLSSSFMKKQKDLYKDIQKNDVENKIHMNESIENIAILKTFQMEKKNLDYLKSIQHEALNLNKLNAKLSSIISFLFNFGTSTGYIFIFSMGAFNLALEKISIGDFTMLIQLYRQVQNPISALYRYIPLIINSISAIERLMDLDNMKIEKSELARKELEFNNRIEFKNVSFAYDDTLDIINNISLTINPGEIVGIIGDSGIGKSTILNILLSTIKLEHGEILIDDDILDYRHRELMAYVPQKNMLFSMSIKENLLYSNGNKNIEDIYEALEISHSRKFVNKLPLGIDTQVNTLSEGQKQRISLARAILKKSPILLLDEATSALDIKTEKLIINSLKNLDYSPTCIIVTHRTPILDICDKVFEIRNKDIIDTNSNKNMDQKYNLAK